jgi:hypothetical protein
MCVLTTRVGWFLAILLMFGVQARAQSNESIGTRAQGMGGAFVGVADDASAVYWNPGGLAGGSYFSLVVDGTTASPDPDELSLSAKRSTWLLALSTPAVGLSYYRLHDEVAAPSPSFGTFHLESLTTQHAGVTLVQSLIDGIAVGATLKLVHGLAGIAEVPANDVDDALDNWDVAGQNSNRFDVDFGVMASGAIGKLGLLVRNTTEPGFKTGNGTELKLTRLFRGGGSILLLPNWKLAADIDFTRTPTTSGDRREFAVGTEAQITRRLAARTGMRLNTIDDNGHAPAFSAGGSFAVVGSLLLDGQVTAGSDKAFRGWGVAGRLAF